MAVSLSSKVISRECLNDFLKQKRITDKDLVSVTECSDGKILIVYRSYGYESSCVSVRRIK